MARSRILLVASLILFELFSLCSSQIPKIFGKAYESATLPCSRTCSGTLTWTKFVKKDDFLVWCDSKSCRPKPGFELSHEEFLRGNLSLTVLSADYDDRGWYVCSCDSKPVCDISLILSPQEFHQEIDPGQPISLNLLISDRVEVTFTGPDPAERGNLPVCTVEHGRVECSGRYEQRAAHLNTLQLREGMFSDGGTYTVRDVTNDEVISITEVHVKELCQDPAVPAWMVGLLVFLAVALVVVSVASLVVILGQRKKMKEFRERNGEANQGVNGHGPDGERRTFVNNNGQHL
ncbi:uncharacterized protein LOC108414199 [Pygocentrus nattereri]|uniref:uncharacterized protein LOC108414199 n=1 Tax=Pygocentrus nattereri TaxID=42514 RepID=UPI0008146351|nr:uncharacterized protein LOC108414199 [Pygocentrus nattereri]